MRLLRRQPRLDHRPPPAAYAPDLDPRRRHLAASAPCGYQAHTAFTVPDDLMHALRSGLRQLQYRSDVLDSCLAATELPLPTTHGQPQ